MEFQSRPSTLEDMAVGSRLGAWARVVDVCANSGRGSQAEREALALRLLELGLVPGTRLRVLRKAPLGSPLLVELRGYNLSLRSEEATAVQVEVVEMVEGKATDA